MSANSDAIHSALIRAIAAAGYSEDEVVAPVPAGVTATNELVGILVLVGCIERLAARVRELEAGDGGRDMTPAEARQAVEDTSGVNDLMRGRSAPKDGDDA